MIWTSIFGSSVQINLWTVLLGVVIALAGMVIGIIVGYVSIPRLQKEWEIERINKQLKHMGYDHPKV